MPLELGNAIFRGDAYQAAEQGILGADGRTYVTLLAIAKLTDTLQTSIPLQVVASSKPNTLQGKYPPVNLSVPVGGQIHRVDFRLPLRGAAGDELQYGIYLPKNCTIIGTSTDNLKVSPTSGTTHTVTAPVIASASNSYTPGAGAVLSRAAGVADQASPSLLTTVSGSPLVLQLTCSNAGNTAAGTGIRLSQTGAIAYAFARVIYSIAGDAIQQINTDWLAAPDSFVTGG
ncbi:hypothetical protein PCC6912_39610 [Chlorogloeopsis fritschii PCC 6912]|uniref:Uncharacterized protein n=1 Tax=Chlorogloeopsis fritschii PCC 6912 TaxID=211165 RepID=A0A433N689_CHLFR|nr:hypothetical protein [Chlorogloeopsis fritschii]RUR77002.1 hypothetical protein PCC6912_39610 [Chlorogloeopsis fritschii PCC 6912]